MRIISKLWKWALAIVIIGIILVVLTPFLTAKLMDHHAVREKLSRSVYETLDVELSYLKAHFAVLPRPYLAIREVQATQGTAFRVQAAAARLYPKLMPLFRGKIELAGISLESPDYILQLPEVSNSQNPPEQTQKLDNVHRQIDRIRYLIQQLTPVNLPDVELTVRNGRVKLVDRNKDRSGPELRHIYARYAHQQNRMDFTVDCMSNVFKEIAVRGWIDPQSFKGVAHIDLAAVRPEGLLDYFFPDSKLRLAGAQLNATLDIDMDGLDQIRVEMMGNIKQLQINHYDSETIFRGQRLHSELVLKGQHLEIQITDFTSAAPRMNLTGKFSIDDENTSVSLNLQGAAVDVAGVRAAALTLWGQDESVTEIFDVLRGGEVPQIKVTASGRRLGDLELFENYIISGQMQNGHLYISDLDFDLQTVSGDALIADGILKGERLNAELGNSRGTGGILSLDLKESGFFKLGIDLRADLAQLPPVLKRLINDKAFISELDRIGDVSGQSSGRLLVSQKGNTTSVSFNATAIRLSAGYDRIPFPVIISGGRLKLDDDSISLSDIKAASGGTALEGISGRIDWKKALRLELKATALKSNAAELNDWLSDLRIGNRWSRTIPELSGALEIKDLVLGYRSAPAANGDLNVGAGIVRADLAAARLPAGLSLEGGTFQYHQDRLTLEKVTARLGKSTLSQLDATFALGVQNTVQASATGAEFVLDELFPWFAELAQHQGAFADLTAMSGTVWLANPKISGPIDNPAEWQWDSGAHLQMFSFQSKTLGAPLSVEKAELSAAKTDIGRGTGTRIDLKPAEINWGASHLSAAGNAGFSSNGLQLALQIAADQLQWPQIEHIIDQAGQSGPSKATTAILGTISVQTDRFQYDDLTWQPVDATVTITPKQVKLAVARAGLCNINFSGHVNFSGDRIDLHLVPAAEGKPLEPTVVCLSKNKDMATGQFDFSGQLNAETKTADLQKSISGDLKLEATGGRIHSLGVLSKIFSILNVTEIYRGQLPDLTGEGFAYETMTIVADVKKSKLTMRQCIVEAPSMGLACEGDIDVAKMQMDLVILVAPFRTVDRIVRNIPIVGGIMGGKLISIPFRAKGELGNPTVIPLSPTAVGSGVLGILERTLKLPINLMQPLFNKSEPDGESAKSQ